MTDRTGSDMNNNHNSARLRVALGVLLAIVLLAALFTAVVMLMGRLQQSIAASESESSSKEYFEVTDMDLSTAAEDGTEYIEFGADDTGYEISGGGVYHLQGTLEGAIHVDAKDEAVHIILAGVDVRSVSGPALYVESAGKTVVTVADGTGNTLRDSTDYDGYERSRACLFSNSDITINGGGRLSVYGDFHDGIRTKEVLKVIDCDLNVKAKNTGVRANDGLLILTEALFVECEGSGLYTVNAKNHKGNLEIGKGKVHIISGEYGISSCKDIYIHSCAAEIYGVLGDLNAGGEMIVEDGCVS